MSNWAEVALSDVFDIARGGSPRPIDDFVTDSPDGINWVTISDASEGSKYITRTKRRIRREGVSRSREVKPGDFLLTNSMSFGRPYIMRTSGCIHDGWLMLSPRRGDVDADFFYHLLGSTRLYSEFERLAAGATVKNLNIDLVKTVKVVLPPLSEQRRIAAILEKADGLRAKRRAALEQLDTLVASVFVKMFGDPATNPRGWRMVRLENVALQVTDGEHITPKRTAHGIKLLSARNVRDGFLDFHDVDFVDEGEYARISKRCKPERGDVLISCSGTVGRVAIVDTDEPLALVRSAALVKLNRSFANPTYFEYYMRTPYMRLRMLSRANASSQANLFQGQIRELPVLLPDRALQEHFAERIGKSLTVRKTQEESGVLLDSLFSSLQHRAFSGAL